MESKTLLITGFDPFGGETVNSAWEAVRLLPDRIGLWRVHKLQIPTVFGDAAETVLEVAGALRPDVILSIGQAGGRAAVTPERIAINVRDARIPDNRGEQPIGRLIAPEGPAAYFTTVPVMTMAQAIRDAGISATVSNSAGAFVCNDVLYSLLHHYHGSATRVGFIHVPYLPQQAKAGVASMPLEEILRALETAIGALEG